MDTSEPPPIDPSQLPTRKPTWNRTIGVIALVFGILGLLGALIAPVSLAFTKKMMTTFEDQGADPDQIAEYLEKLTSLSYLSVTGLAILAILLSVGGFFLLKRNPLGAPLLQIWAVLKIVLGCYFNYRNYGLTQMQMKIQMSVDGMNAQAAEMTETITNVAVLGGMIFGILWLIALPVFLLIWLNRAKIKQEIQSWKD
ncbi:MAG: hypothetical protein MI807_19005 [Verrucomicrobiales bacterium]|nr:hypothetical protein [Verrucomicrobiales bacterium]